MRVLVKTVSNKDKPMEVIVADDAAVSQLIESLLNDHSYKATKIVFKGKVLAAADKLSDAGVVDGEYCVVIGSKATGAAATASKAVEEKKKEEAVKEAAQKEEEKKDPPAASSTAPAAADSSEASAAAAGALVSGDEVDETISMIMMMNPDWTREMVQRALRAAFNNPDRAVEFLLTGNIPSHEPPAPPAAATGTTSAPEASAQGGSPAESGSPHEIVIPGVGTLSPQQVAQILAIINQRPGQPPPDPQALAAFLSEMARVSQQAGGAAPAAQGSGSGGAAPAAGGAGLSPLAQRLRQIAEFDQIRSLVAQDGSQLSRVMMTIREQDPELFTMVQQNQDEFLRLLRDGIPGGSGGGGAPQQRTVTITEEDRQAIERLTQLGGFSNEEALQAYIAADRNEELAANLLFDAGASMDQD